MTSKEKKKHDGKWFALGTKEGFNLLSRWTYYTGIIGPRFFFLELNLSKYLKYFGGDMVVG